MNAKAFAAGIINISSTMANLVNSLIHISNTPKLQGQNGVIVENFQGLATALSKFMAAAQPAITGTGSKQELLVNGRIIGISTAKLTKVLNLNEIREEQLKRIYEKIKEIVDELMSDTKQVATKCPDARS